MNYFQSGFSLIELMVVLTIIGILTATAVPQYKEYRMRAFDMRANSDLRNAAIAEEAYFLDTEKYLSCVNEQCVALPGLSAISSGVSLTINATNSDYLIESTHSQGTGRVFHWDSANGGAS